MPVLYVEGKKHETEEVKEENHSQVIRVDGRQIQVEILREISRDPLVLLVRSGNRVVHVSVREKEAPDQYSVQLNEKPVSVKIEHEAIRSVSTGVPEGPILISAPMAGRITSMKATPGAIAEEGQALLVLEAMKMENEIAAPRRGVVKEIYVQPGTLVKPGDKLVLLG